MGGRRILQGFMGAAAAALVLTVWAVHRPVRAALRTHPYFTVDEVVLHGVGPLLSRDDVLAWLGVRGGVSLWDVAPARVEARLEAHPLIERATVRREFPNHVEIELRERRPQAVAVLEDLYYVGRGGQLLRVLGAEHSRDYPLVTGLMPDTNPGYRTWALRRALRLVRLCERVACFGGVSEIRLDRRFGLVLYPTAPRVPLLLGWGSWREKLARAGRALQAWEGRTDQLAMLDVRFRNQVVARLRAPSAAPFLSGNGRVGT